MLETNCRPIELNHDMQQVEKGFDHRDSHPSPLPSPLASCSVEYSSSRSRKCIS